MPQLRREHAAMRFTTVHSLAFVLAGAIVSRFADSRNATSPGWYQVRSALPSVDGAAYTDDGYGGFYAAGGFSGGEDGNDIWHYNTSSGWVQVPPASGRYVRVSDNSAIFQNTPSPPHRWPCRATVSTSVDRVPFPCPHICRSMTPRMRSCMVRLGTQLYIFGGKWQNSQGADVNDYNDVWSFDLQARVWSQILNPPGCPHCPVGRSAVSCTLRGNSMLIYGGITVTGKLLSTFWAFHIPSNTWALVQENRTSWPTQSMQQTAYDDHPVPVYASSAIYDNQTDTMILHGGRGLGANGMNADAYVSPVTYVFVFDRKPDTGVNATNNAPTFLGVSGRWTSIQTSGAAVPRAFDVPMFWRRHLCIAFGMDYVGGVGARLVSSFSCLNVGAVLSFWQLDVAQAASNVSSSSVARRAENSFNGGIDATVLQPQAGVRRTTSVEQISVPVQQQPSASPSPAATLPFPQWFDLAGSGFLTVRIGAVGSLISPENDQIIIAAGGTYENVLLSDTWLLQLPQPPEVDPSAWNAATSDEAGEGLSAYFAYAGTLVGISGLMLLLLVSRLRRRRMRQQLEREMREEAAEEARERAEEEAARGLDPVVMQALPVINFKSPNPHAGGPTRAVHGRGINANDVVIIDPGSLSSNNVQRTLFPAGTHGAAGISDDDHFLNLPGTSTHPGDHQPVSLLEQLQAARSISSAASGIQRSSSSRAVVAGGRQILPSSGAAGSARALLPQHASGMSHDNPSGNPRSGAMRPRSMLSAVQSFASGGGAGAGGSSWILFGSRTTGRVRVASSDTRTGGGATSVDDHHDHHPSRSGNSAAAGLRRHSRDSNASEEASDSDSSYERERRRIARRIRAEAADSATPVRPLTADEARASISKVLAQRTRTCAFDPESQLSCPICLLDYEEGCELTVLPCLHRYHSACVHTWLADHRICPQCRDDVARAAAGGGGGNAEYAGAGGR